MARHQPPQDAVLDDRHRCRCRDAHVPEILDVDRRHRAHADVAQVYGLQRRVDRHDRRGDIVHVGDHPHAVADIERAGLPRNVGRREMMVQEPGHVGRMAFRHNLSRIIVEKAIDHDAVEPGQPREDDRRPRAQIVEVGRARESFTAMFDPGQCIVGARLSRRHRFHFDQPHLPRAAGDDRPCGMVDRAQRHGAGDGRSQHLQPGIADQVEDRSAQPGRAEQCGDVAGATDDHALARVDDQQHAMRLDRAGNMDRFAVADGQVMPQVRWRRSTRRGAILRFRISLPSPDLSSSSYSPTTRIVAGTYCNTV